MGERPEAKSALLHQDYSARIPFRLLQGTEIALDTEHVFSFDGKPARLGRRGDWYILRVDGCLGQPEGERLREKLTAVLQVAAASLHWPLQLERSVGHIAWSPDPERSAEHLGFTEPVHGLGDGYLPSVFPTDREPRWIYMGDVTATVRRNPASLSAEMAARCSLASVDLELQLALDFYFSHFTLGTRTARLIALVICLETLRDESPNPPVVGELVERWQREAKASADSAGEPEVVHALNQLAQSVGYLKQTSLTRQIKSLVGKAYASGPSSEQEEAVRAAGDCYRIRSLIAHGSAVSDESVRQAVSALEELVPRVLLHRATAPSQ
ncbi:hypothetical protein TBR22_A19040 [Luteitalea sp. TBR-22]|uniref:hypothetical protein n=1 Tax=Luteitalea sp. TBR-22 TaxID=2802971 RepID=UPI001EF68B75|nr:hypothetical protein [Luteitalea sp. TBR-22]BCS32682.2 hypothetical protein TBR22_A19040 [Luteitalea sp. TBR-22]